VIGARPDVRRATAADRPRLATALARAFHDDPVMSWFFPEDDKREARNRRFFGMRLRQLVPQGESYTVDGCRAGALWTVPGAWHLSNLETARMAIALAPALGRRMGRVLKGVDRIERTHPEEPHYYLAVLGTEPELQGQGVGSALMRPVLDGCDRDEVAAYLESSKERNIAFYARHGFRVTGEVTLPDGPTVWSMWREPRP
jgi:GNAT superfamily N-acetyltransferase